MGDTEQVEECILERKVTRFAAAQVASCKDECLRRSVRDPSISMMDRNDLSILLERIRTNHASSVVLKIKDHLIADISSSVFDAIVETLWKNKVCQGLYIQNLAKAIGDVQLHALVELLKKKMIWCLNIGESYEVSMEGWRFFCASLPKTNVTHLYVSEHTIPIDLKNEMRDHIRDNRKKHNLHCVFKNLSVIERCTHMWWNPINGVKELKPPPPEPETESEEEEEEEEAVPVVIALTPAHTAYWQEGVGEGGDKPWKFKCMCGETCSSYENFRYHPTGRMYECSNPACCLWSHVNCVLGPSFSDKELETRKDLLCGACKAKSRRLSKYMGVSITELNAPPPAEPAPLPQEGASKGAAGKDGTKVKVDKSARPDAEDDGKPWSFRCKCGEVCSSYEKAMYHPAGQWYECSQCAVWSHVHCMLGKVTPEQILEMKEVLCFSCTSKSRRSRPRGAVEEVPKQAPVDPASATVVEPTVKEETCLASQTFCPAVPATTSSADPDCCHDIAATSAVLESALLRQYGAEGSSELASSADTFCSAPDPAELLTVHPQGSDESVELLELPCVVTEDTAATAADQSATDGEQHIHSCGAEEVSQQPFDQEMNCSTASCMDEVPQGDAEPIISQDFEPEAAVLSDSKRKSDFTDDREQKVPCVVMHVEEYSK